MRTSFVLSLQNKNRVCFKGLFGEKNRMEWNEDLNPGGLGMELES